MGIGGTGGGGQPGQIQGSDKQNAMMGAQLSINDMENRYKQLGLGGRGASPTGPTTGAVAGVPGSGTTPVNLNPGAFDAGPTGFQMDVGTAPSLTGGIPRQFQGALGEGQFQDLSETTSAAVGAQQAKGQVAQGIGGLIGGI
jgi:hypothetical protein